MSASVGALYEGAEVYALRLLSRGDLSLSRAAALLGLTPGEVLDLAAARGVEIGGTLAQHKTRRERAMGTPSG